MHYVVFIFISLITCVLPVAADSCGTCYANNGKTCEQRCIKFSDERKERCMKPCLLQYCKEECGYESSSTAGSSRSHLADCDYCQRKNSQDCSRQCLDKSPSCNKICISNACRSSCGLPAPPSSLLKSGDRNKECTQCKTNTEHSCKSSCGSGAGSVSCAVACVERNCFNSCLID